MNERNLKWGTESDLFRLGALCHLAYMWSVTKRKLPALSKEV